tara:strand:- start:1331 stop:1597 length:267 start_codon:yes stop_codon:yes gene_type:complete
MSKYVNKNGKFNHGKWLREKSLQGSLDEGIKSNIMQKWDTTDTMVNDLRQFVQEATDAGGPDLVRDIADALKLMTNYALGEYKKAKKR